LPERFTGKFSTFIYKFVQLRLKGIRDKNNKVILKSLDSTVDTVGSDDQEPQAIMFAYGVPDEEFQNIELRNLCQKVYLKLKLITAVSDTRDFPELFKRLVESAFSQVSGFDREAYAREKGITNSAVSMQIKELKSYLVQCGFKYALEQASNRRLSL
jgi:hypothetical protein